MNKRRTFLGYLSSTALLPLLAAPTAATPGLTGTEDLSVIRVLQEIMPDNAATRRLGVAALRKFKTTDISDLAPGRLSDSLAKMKLPTADQVRRHLQVLRDADFAAGKTMTVDGWILARSEAEAIALVALHREV